MGADAVREETTVTGDWGAADATARRTDNGSMAGEGLAAGSGVRTKLARVLFRGARSQRLAAF